MLGDDEDVFDSVTWESPAAPQDTVGFATPSGPGYRQATAAESEEGRGPYDPKWEGYLITSVKDPVKELAETKDAYVSYLVSAKTNLPVFSMPNPSSRRRFQDFVFLRDHLSRDFPACVVPPLPDKHRLEYVTGDRFSPEFMERRRLELHRFLQRLSRHPTLQRSTLLRAFFESTEWHVHMHQHVAHPPGPEQSAGVIDSISDTLLNAFSRVRKPDERFLAMREGVDKFEEGLALSERLWTRMRTRTNGEYLPRPPLRAHVSGVRVSEAEGDGNPEPGEDLTGDYHDLAVAVQGLGFLESGITDPLNHFSNTLLEFSALLRHTTHTTSDPFLVHLHSLLMYSHANRAVLKLRDQKQMDFEELSDYLSGVTAERDRLAAVISGHAGSTGLGLGAYIKDRVDALRGADDDRSRVERMRNLDGKIKELQDAVTTAHETSDAFSDETLREQTIFQHGKDAEMKEMFGNLADGQIEFYRAAMEEWERIIPIIQRIRVDV
ncbi:lipid binding protein [Amylocystis lapponica]|nr:lipid binding protein [Amylocystis lapponica]